MDKYTETLGKDVDDFIDLLVDEIHRKFPDNNYDVKICNNISTDNHLEIEFRCIKYDSPEINELAESRLKAIQTK
jgi:hypothetical protein